MVFRREHRDMWCPLRRFKITVCNKLPNTLQHYNEVSFCIQGSTRSKLCEYNTLILCDTSTNPAAMLTPNQTIIGSLVQVTGFPFIPAPG